MNNESHKKKEAGFSLIELMIVSAILVFVIGIMGGVVAAVQRSYAIQHFRTDSLNDATAATDMMARLIRMAGNNPNGIAGLRPIDPGTADANGIYRTMRIRSDWHGSTMSSYPDGDIGDSYEDVNFFVDATTQKLMKQEPSDASPVEFLEDALSLQFDYYDTNNVAIPDPVANNGSICRVKITVVMLPPYSTPVIFQTSAFVRAR